jgi:Flp pilus assembly protein CpaB
MSRSAIFLIALVAIMVAGVVGLVMMANSAQPPQRQVEQTIPDERLPK